MAVKAGVSSSLARLDFRIVSLFVFQALLSLRRSHTHALKKFPYGKRRHEPLTFFHNLGYYCFTCF